MSPTSTAPPKTTERRQPEPPAAAVATEEVAPAQPVRTDLRVRAIKPGFYPDPGQIRARPRKVGDVFTLRVLRHFAPETADKSGWMEWYNEPSSLVDRGEIPVQTVPNQIQDPLSFGAEQARMTERAGEPKQKVAWPDGSKQVDGPAGSQVPLEPMPHAKDR